MSLEALHRFCLQKILLPSHNRLSGARSVSIWRFLDESQWWPAERLEEYQWGELRGLLRVAFESVPYYRRRHPGVSWQDIRCWRDFQKLPPLTRDEVNACREELRSSELPLSACHIHATGGSSGAPLRFYRTLDSYDWRTAATRRTYSWTGYQYGDKALYLWGAPTGRVPAAKRAKMALSERAYNRRTLVSFSQDDDLWSRAREILRRWRPSYLVGYVSSLIQFARYLERNRLDPIGLRGVLTAAEPLDEVQRGYLQRVLDSPVYNTYGSREFMSIGGECGARQGLHYAAENLVVESDGPEGAPGDLLVTDLHNHGTVFLRYRIGDVGTVTRSRCECGRGLPMLGSVGGRSADCLEMADGRRISGLLFFHVMKDVPEVLQFQVVQARRDHLTISVVVSGPMCSRSREFFSNEMRRYLGPNTWEFNEVDRLPVLSSGKIRVVVPLRPVSPDTVTS